MSHAYNINHGRDVLRCIVDRIKTSNDTADWTDYEWDEALQERFEEIGEVEPGDIADVVGYVIDRYDKDGSTDMIARIGIYGLTAEIAGVVYAAEYLGEDCRLLS